MMRKLENLLLALDVVIDILVVISIIALGVVGAMKMLGVI
jgi:hypothetical protein